jgi:hypothetical protein
MKEACFFLKGSILFARSSLRALRYGSASQPWFRVPQLGEPVFFLGFKLIAVVI